MKEKQEFLEDEHEWAKDAIYLMEDRIEKERTFWEWYYSQEGSVRVENPDGTPVKEEELVTTDDYFLPF